MEVKMKLGAHSMLLSLLAGFLGSLCGGATWAATQSVPINSLTFTDTLSTPLFAGDTLLLDTLITNGSSAPLSQSVTFTAGSGVTGAIGQAAWLVSTPTLGPRLIGVNIDVINAATDTVLFSDTNTSVTNRVATSALNSVDDLGSPIPLPPGTYKLVATGNAG